ncbi:MYCBP-associated protein-like isoform X2 [Littorina saxatilis]|uniref:MYCBP-associated protein-like isoform X2 n=1 Tax=Littorina saxatilis TaxID=31220 RepID=UPI0038B50B09
MSSKLNVKQGKKDRPKSSDRLKGKRRDGTPDKSATPSQQAQDENRPPSRQIIWDEEIEKLQIKAEELDKIKAPVPPSEPRTPVHTKLTVRKMKPASELNKPKLRSVMVAKPASPDAQLKPIDMSGYAGPKYDEKGQVISHSILGSYDDFRREAVARGDLLDIPTPRIHDASHDEDNRLTVKYEKKRKRTTRETPRKSEDNALRHWQQKMIERKRQQGYISKLLQKAPEDLVMNQVDNFRTVQEDRYLIDRTIPFLDYGKGYRVGSEFWKQQERFGDELAGVHMTLTQSERGYPAPVEHVGIPNCVREEKGVEWEPEYQNPVHHPWHRSSYLQQRRKQLQPIIGELDPHKPDFAGLQVIGTSDPSGKQEAEKGWDEGMEADFDPAQFDHMTEEQKQQIQEDPFHEYPDVRGPPIFGPSLQFAGQTARWTGDSNSMAGQVGIEARVTLETYTGTRVTSYLEVVNDGTTSVFFDWKKLPKENPFDLIQPEVQRFYFNNSSGVVLPGETLRIPFVFKSDCAGVFTEQWLLETSPVLCGGAALALTLRGVALQEDKYQKQREELERDLETKQSMQIVTQLLEDMVGGIRTPVRCRSPVDAYITEEDIFHRHNPGLFYRHEAVMEMKQIHQQLVPEEERDTAVWDLCVLDIRDMIMALDEDDERKEALLVQLNNIASRLTFAPQIPVQQKLHNLCYKLLAEAVDSIVGQSTQIRHTMGMTAREMTDMFEERLHGKKRDSKPVTQKKPDTASSPEGDSRKGARPADKGKQEPAKDGKKPAAAKDAKAGKAAKEPAKPDPKVKAPTPSGLKKTPVPTRPSGGGPGLPDPRTSTPTSPPQTPASHEHEQVQERKYLEKLYTQAFLILAEKADQMDQVFQDTLQAEAQANKFRPL